MPKHEFGIMQSHPISGKRYDDYEPQKYDCISIDDAYIEPLLSQLAEINMYWHTLDVRGRGLAYCGVTLIPPFSIDSILLLLSDREEYAELTQLLLRAKTDDKFVIHFGI